MTNERGQLRDLRAELRVGTLCCFTRRSPNIKTIVKHLLRDIEKGIRSC